MIRSWHGRNEALQCLAYLICVTKKRCVAAAGNGKRLRVRAERGGGMHAGGRHQAIALPGDPQAGACELR